VIEPQEAWEGTELYDPWAVELGGGRVRLYYAAPGGIGIAEASNVGGTFTRLVTTPIVTPSGSMTEARWPAVAHDDELGWLMYFDGGDGIYVATSSDGIAFSLGNGGAPLSLLRSDDQLPSGAPSEDTAQHPGVAIALTPLGRKVVRLYFSITLREEGMLGPTFTSVISMAGSLDGVSFDRLNGYSFAVTGTNADSPSPLVLDEGASTALVATQGAVISSLGNLQVRAPIGLVTPIDYDFGFTPTTP
jgi:hypothetical protein